MGRETDGRLHVNRQQQEAKLLTLNQARAHIKATQQCRVDFLTEYLKNM